MAARIARHRAERPPAWRTVEVPLALASALTALEGEADVVVVDCLNLWVANMLDKRPELTDSDLMAEAAQLEAVATAPALLPHPRLERGRLGGPSRRRSSAGAFAMRSAWSTRPWRGPLTRWC